MSKKLNISKDFLIEEYIKNNKKISEIAIEYGCASSVISTNLKDFGIKTRPRGFKRLIEKKELERKYVAGEQVRKIAEDFRVSTATVLYYIKYYGIQKHGQLGKYNHRYGKKCPESGKRLKILWNNQEFRDKALKAPRTKEAIKNNKLSKQKFWKSMKGLKLKVRRSLAGKIFYENNKEHFVEMGKKGQAACRRISSVEIKVCKILKELNINVISQYNYKLGVADIFVEPNKIIEVYGDYWHNYPSGREKDKKQIEYLKNNNYEVLIIWEHELKNMTNLKKKLIKYIGK